MNTTQNQRQPTPPDQAMTTISPEASIKALRSAILALATKSPTAANVDDRGLGVPQKWDHLNSFIRLNAHKMLFQMTVQQLAELHEKMIVMRNRGWIYRQSDVTIN